MSLRSFLKRNLPAQHTFHDHHHLRHFGELLHDPNLWHLTRYSSAGGVAVGLFCAFIPLPLQTIIAAILAIMFRVNLPLSILLVWVTNPVTIAPVFLFAYKLGTWILDIPARHLEFQFTLEWLSEIYVLIWKPLLLGSLILGTISAIFGYFFMIWLWRIISIRKWRERQDRRSTKKN